MEIQVGLSAPDFTLFDENKNKTTLSDLKGHNVILLFFPLAFTSTCTEELCSMRDNIATYEKLDAKVFGISVDSLYSLKKFKEEQKLNFPLLSDFNKEVSTLYGSLYPIFGYNMKGVSKRSAFVIDKDGKVRYAEVLENAGLIPDFKAVQETLKSMEKS